MRSLRGLLGPGDTARQSLVALALNSSTSLAAGAFLGSITGTFERLPGLLILLPAAIGLRGNVFSTFGNRLSTAIHTGQFEPSLRSDRVLGANVIASLDLTLAMSLALAVFAKIVAVALGIEDTVPVLHLAMISILGGALASLIVLLAALALAGGAVRYGWDLDNVVAPVVSTLGDVVTLPALWVATFLVDVPLLASVSGALLATASVASFLAGWRSRVAVVRRVVREATPILLLAAALSTLAGLVIQQRLTTFSTYPALFVLVPAFISSAGALGGILSSRLSSKLHLGFTEAAWIPDRESRVDVGSVFLLGAPVYLFNAVGAEIVARLVGGASPGLVALVGASMLGGFVTVAFVVIVAYYGTVVATVVHVDPDTYGIPIVTSSVDFVGAISLVAAAVMLGLA